MVAFLEWERRFGDRWIAALQGRWLINTDPTAPLHGLRDDSLLTLRLSPLFLTRWPADSRQNAGVGPLSFEANYVQASWNFHF